LSAIILFCGIAVPATQHRLRGATRSNVEVSTDSNSGRPSTSEGKSTLRYSSLKRAAEDDDGDTSEASETVNIQDNQHYIQGIVTHNRFACLAVDENITDDISCTAQKQTNLTSTQNTRRKRFARDNDNNNHTQQQSHDAAQTPITREKKPPPIYLTSKVKNYVAFAKALKESVGDNFQLKFLGDQIKIQFHKVKDFGLG